MGFLDEFINSQIGGIGALLGLYQRKKFDTAHNFAFVPALKSGTIILQGPVHADYISGGIQRATDSFWTHTLVCTEKHGENNFEFIEATLPKVRIGLLSEYLTDKVQQIAFIPKNISKETLKKIFDYAYSRIGTKYDISEIVSDALPNLRIHHNPKLHGCSSLIATAFANGGISIVPPTVAPAAASPKDIYMSLYPNKEDWSIAKWNY